MTTRRREMPDTNAVITELIDYGRAQGWAGHDPYDALNSRLLAWLPFLDSRVPRLALTQALKRSPVNLRSMMRIPRTQNAKAIALVLSALVRLARGAFSGLEDAMIARLASLRSNDPHYCCWGYSFPWQTRTMVIPRGAPNLVCTVFAASALLDVCDVRRDPSCLRMAVSAGEYILERLYWTDGAASGFAYPQPSSRGQIHNANLLAAALLCRIAARTGDARFLAPALAAARFSASRQRPDGSWPYGERADQQWIDNFHSGYNLCALRALSHDAETTEFDACVRRGFAFYRAHFIRADGAARYFHDRTYPIDIHAVAQTIITLCELRDLDAGNLELAQRVFRWAIRHMRDARGYFYYRVLRLVTIRTSYFRWAQAWMLLAAATLQEAAPGAAWSGRPRAVA